MKITNTRKWIAAIAIGFTATSAFADDSVAPASKLVMSAVEDTAAGRQVLAGEYKSAADEIEKNTRISDDKYAKATNLCVSLTLSEQFDKAEAACESAVRQSRKSSYQYSLIHEKNGGPNVQRAVALSNLGVLKVLTGDLDAGQTYFERAEKIRSTVENPTLNLKHLKSIRSRIAKR